MKEEKKNILVVDDNLTICLMLKSWLAKNNYNVDVASSVEEAIGKIKNGVFDLVLSDIRMPDADGFSFLSWVSKYDSGIQVIMMTSFADISSAVDSIKMGAVDYIPKPIDAELLFHKIEEALKISDIKKQSSGFIKQFINPEGMDSEYNHYKMIDTIRNSSHLLIIGDNGTGKDTAVKFIYLKGIGDRGPIEILDMNVLSKEAFVDGSLHNLLSEHAERAKDGLLHIKGLKKIDLQMQNSLLWLLTKQNRDKNFTQIIITTTKTKEQLKELLMPKLYDVLLESCIELPTIMGRELAISSYTDHFLKMANRELDKNITKIDKAVLEALYKHSWKGNVQELKNVIIKMALITDGDVITKEAIHCISSGNECFVMNPESSGSDHMEGFKRENYEKQKISEALDIAKGNKTLAATLLNIDRKTLYNKIRIYKI